MISTNSPKKGTTIKCSCGSEIPVIPNAEAVGNFIDAHIEEHRRQQPDPAQGEIVAKEVHDKLFKALFKKIGSAPT
jgi:hypothetical protein